MNYDEPQVRGILRLSRTPFTTRKRKQQLIGLIISFGILIPISRRAPETRIPERRAPEPVGREPGGIRKLEKHVSRNPNDEVAKAKLAIA